VLPHAYRAVTRICFCLRCIQIQFGTVYLKR
jgi:hypothetical protein